MGLTDEQKRTLLKNLEALDSAGEGLVVGKDFSNLNRVADEIGEIHSAVQAVYGSRTKSQWLSTYLSDDRSAVNADIYARLLSGFQRSERASYFRRGIEPKEHDLISEVIAAAWVSAVMHASNTSTPDGPALDVADAKKLLTDEYMNSLAGLSTQANGPLLAIDVLKESGIRFFPLEGPPGIAVDGMSFVNEKRQPVIAMTLRRNRLDYFWFTLFHELAHVKLHLGASNREIVDDLESEASADSQVEREANHVAANWLIPRSEWRRSSAFRSPSADAVLELAERVGRHPSIVAGRLRFEAHDYSMFSDMVGQGELSKMFGQNG